MNKMAIPINSKVILKNGPDAVYSRAWVGSEGWVRDAKTDNDGFELVYIEWERDWRYNEQLDGWTFASHFDIKEIGDPSIEVPSKRKNDKDDDKFVSTEEYIEKLEEAFDASAGSEGFLMISVERMRDPDNPSHTVFVPHLNSASLSVEAQASLGVILANKLSDDHQEMMSFMIRAFDSTRDDGDTE